MPVVDIYEVISHAEQLVPLRNAHCQCDTSEARHSGVAYCLVQPLPPDSHAKSISSDIPAESGLVEGESQQQQLSHACVQLRKVKFTPWKAWLRKPQDCR